MTINSLEIVNKIEGNKKAISFFLKNLNITHDANIWMINGSKGIGKSFLVKLIASSLLAIEYKDNESKDIFHPDLVILNKNDNKTEILLLLAARYEHYKKLIEPAITNGNIIICDRFIDSTLAYQCAGNNELKEFYFQLSKSLINKFEPDLTILLDISPIKALERINERKNKNKASLWWLLNSF